MFIGSPYREQHTCLQGICPGILSLSGMDSGEHLIIFLPTVGDIALYHGVTGDSLWHTPLKIIAPLIPLACNCTSSRVPSQRKQSIPWSLIAHLEIPSTTPLTGRWLWVSPSQRQGGGGGGNEGRVQKKKGTLRKGRDQINVLNIEWRVRLQSSTTCIPCHEVHLHSVLEHLAFWLHYEFWGKNFPWRPASLAQTAKPCALDLWQMKHSSPGKEQLQSPPHMKTKSRITHCYTIPS